MKQHQRQTAIPFLFLPGIQNNLIVRGLSWKVEDVDFYTLSECFTTCQKMFVPGLENLWLAHAKLLLDVTTYSYLYLEYLLFKQFCKKPNLTGRWKRNILSRGYISCQEIWTEAIPRHPQIMNRQWIQQSTYTKGIFGKGMKPDRSDVARTLRVNILTLGKYSIESL